MSKTGAKNIRESKRGGGVVFVAMFLSPFVAIAAVGLTRALSGAPAWAPIVALALVHWVMVTLYIQKRAKGTANVFVWSVAAVLADFMWYGVLLSLADAYG